MMLDRTDRRRSILLTMLSGVLLALSLPPFPAPWLAWVALAPLLLAVRKLGPWLAFQMGVLSGVVCGAVYLGQTLLHGVSNMAITPFSCLSIFLGLACLLAVQMWRRWDGPRAALFMAVGGVALEWLTTFSPLPLHLALTQHRMLPLIQIASVAGIWSVSFLIWWLNAAVAGALAERRWKTPALAIGVATLLLTLGYGAARLKLSGPERHLRVAAIQDYSGEYSDGSDASTADLPDREMLTSQAAARGARLVVWSEECLGRGFNADDPEDRTAALARDLGVYMVVGYEEAASPLDFNCAALLSPKGATLGVHHKIHLYMGERNAVQSGRAARAWRTPLGRVGMEICFDSCYTGVTRRMARNGARLIAMPNFDPPSARGTLHYLHASLLPFRAVENDVAFVRADANGLSQVISPNGRILGQSPLWRPDALVRDVSLGNGRGTVFTRLGDWLAYLCVAATVLLLIAAGFSGHQQARAEQREPDAVASPKKKEPQAAG